MDKRLKSIVLTENELDSKTTEISVDINYYYKDKASPIMLGVLNGCAIFYGQLLTKLNFDLETEFLRYKIVDDKPEFSFSFQPGHVKGRNVFVIGDIADTGKTFSQLKSTLIEQGAADVKFAILIDKYTQREVEFIPDWVLHETDTTEWLVGYGTDFSNDLVHLPYIAVAKKDE